MADQDGSTALFTADTDPSDLEEYRPLSPLAVWAAIAAFLSLAAPLHFLLWVLPAVSSVLSISALASLRKDSSRQTGRGLATLSLLLALFVAGYLAARTTSRQQAVSQQAQVYSSGWLDLLRSGRVHEAHQLTKPSYERYSGTAFLEDYYADKVHEHSSEEDAMMMTSPRDELKTFLADPVIARIVDAGDSARFEYLGDVSQSRKGTEVRVTQSYAVTSGSGAASERAVFLVLARRLLNESDKLGDWSVQTVDE